MPTPPDNLDPLAQLAAPLLGLKPFLWFAGVVAGAMLFYNAFDARLARVEDGIATLTTIVCADPARGNDSHCKRAMR